MSQCRTLELTLLLVMLVSVTFVPAAASTPVLNGTEPPLPTGQDVGATLGGRPMYSPLRLLSSTAAGITLELDVPWEGLSLDAVTAGEKDYVRLMMPGWSATTLAGAPELPLQSAAIGVPFGVGVAISVEPGVAHTMRLSAPVIPAPTQTVTWPAEAGLLGVAGYGREPAALPQPSLALEPDLSIYGTAAAYPGVLAQVTGDGVLRQQRVVGIAAYPVQYNPNAGQITVYENLRIEIKFDGPIDSGQPAAPESASYESVLRQELLNHEAARQWRQRILPTFPLQAEGIEGGPLPWSPPSPGWRVKVREDGFYRLTPAELQAAGLPVSTLDPRTFQLYHLGAEVAIEVAGEADGHFDSGDWLVFYGQAIDDKYTRDNVYWLTYGARPGLRMGTRDGTPGVAEIPIYYGAQLRMEQSGFYIPIMPGDENLERWVWDYVYAPSRPSWSHTFSLPAPYAGSYSAMLKITMLGYLQNSVNPDHHTQVYLNGVLLEDATWDGISWHVSEISVPQSLLVAGDNTISVVCPNDTGVGVDVVYVDSVELLYGNTFLAVDDELSFGYEATGTWKLRADGFSASPVAVYDVTAPEAVVRIGGVSVTASAFGYAAQFQDVVAAPTAYWALAPTAYRSAQSIEVDTASNLGSSLNGADYILITHRDFWNPVAALRDFRASQGLRALRVDVKDVYDEFGYGIEGAAPIRDFLAYAYRNWQAPAPSFVVLVGDGNYDPKDHLSYGRTSYMPPYLAPVDPWMGETAADNRYVTVVGGDNLPDMMAGRLAVNTSTEASAMVSKIVAYEQSPVAGDWKQRILAVADNADQVGDFAQTSENLLASYLVQPYQAERVYYGVTHTTPDQARTAIQDGINAGKLLVNFVGHADQISWAAERMFKTDDVPLLQNGGKLPVMLPMTCWDGYYIYPYPPDRALDALAEVVTRADGRGAVASWSPTGLGVATGHDSLNRGFFQAVFLDNLRELGQATHAGKLRLWSSGSNRDLLDTYLLFGDPATSLPLPPLPHLHVFLPMVLKP
jgi:hypothetical protein